jgi:hypothetical protein
VGELKLTKSLIRVAERVLGIVGTPLPTSINDRVQLVAEARAIRHWEEFDEGILRWSARGNAAAVAAQFGVFALTTSAAGSADCPRGTIITLDHAYSEVAAVQTRFGWADLATITVAGNPTVGMKDRRNRSFLANSLPLAFVQGTQVGAVTMNDRIVFQALGSDTDNNPEAWGYTQTPTGPAGGAGEVLAFVTNVVNTALTVRCSGRIIFPK